MKHLPVVVMCAGCLVAFCGLVSVFGPSDDPAMIVAGSILISGGLVASRLGPQPSQ